MSRWHEWCKIHHDKDFDMVNTENKSSPCWKYNFQMQYPEWKYLNFDISLKVVPIDNESSLI